MKEIYKNINQLLLSLPRNAVVTSSGLAENGISYRLQHYYQNKKNAGIDWSRGLCTNEF